jgi:hypothetical protein
MGKHASFLKGTAETLRRIAAEGEKSYGEAADAIDQAEERNERLDAKQKADLAAKYPALGRQ